MYAICLITGGFALFLLFGLEFEYVDCRILARLREDWRIFIFCTELLESTTIS